MSALDALTRGAPLDLPWFVWWTFMENFWAFLSGLWTAEKLLMAGRAAGVLVVGLLMAWAVGALLRRLLATRASPQYALLLTRAARYGLVALTLVVMLYELGVHPGALLGTAGVLTVALGFASQTAASNIISGLFLLAEGSFKVGDLIEVDGVRGKVTSVDLLSIRLQTLDNLMVRIANETLIKTRFTNFAHYPIRRADFLFGLAYDADLKVARELLEAIAERHPLCFVEPAPLFVYLAFEESAVRFQFSVWTARENYVAVRNDLPLQMLKAFREANLPVARPLRVVQLEHVHPPGAIAGALAGSEPPEP